jgi:hypothetical protein
MGNIVNRVFDSSGPDGKVRGTPQQIIDKYSQLARDAHLGNDRVAVENFQQHAEHYTRLLGEALREQEAKRESQEAQMQAQQRNRQNDRDQRGDQGEPRTVDPGSAPQPHTGAAVPLGAADAEGSGLVETPESTSKAPDVAPKPRRPRRTVSDKKTSGDDTPDQPQAAE